MIFMRGAAAIILKAFSGSGEKIARFPLARFVGRRVIRQRSYSAGGNGFISSCGTAATVPHASLLSAKLIANEQASFPK
jgi:hypothetical protein